MPLKLALLLCMMMVGLSYCASQQGVPYRGSCPPQYPYDRICFKSYSKSQYGCFETYETSCCGCDDIVCYGCATMSHCPGQLGKCKPTSMPTWALVMAISMPIILTTVVVVVLICVFRSIASRVRQNPAKSVTFNIPSPASPTPPIRTPLSFSLYYSSSASRSTTSSLSQSEMSDIKEDDLSIPHASSTTGNQTVSEPKTSVSQCQESTPHDETEVGGTGSSARTAEISLHLDNAGAGMVAMNHSFE